MNGTLCLSALLAALTAAAVDVPETYRVIAQRNIFSPSRSPRSVAQPPPAAPPPPPVETVTLTGVVVLARQPVALFSGPHAGLGGMRRLGERLDLGVVAEIDTAGVTLDMGADAGRVRLLVGQSLTRTAGKPWSVSADAGPGGAPGQGPPVAAAAGSSAAAPSSGGGEAASDVLKRLMERRRKELNP